MLKYCIISALLLISSIANAQLKGIVLGKAHDKEAPIYRAKIKSVVAGEGTLTGEDGQFQIILPKDLPDTLVISAFGYLSDTIIVTKEDRFGSLKITLFSDQLLPEIIVTFKRDTKSISRLKVQHLENLGLGELRKAACCNLSESFETNASVDVNITDAVSGAKKIQMMGLDGVYTQIQMENIPYLRGLESSFGLHSMPGTWINSIQITKGTGTVVNGYESMAGLVNMELHKPQEMERLFVNAYGNRFGRAEVNLHSGIKINEKWSTGIFAHGAGVFVENDHNDDGFMDVPTGTTAAFLNRWQYQGKNMEAQFGFNAYNDSKTGGQVGYKRGPASGKYGVEMDASHIDVFLKTGIFMKKPYNSIGLVSDFKYQTVDALFGNHIFRGVEQRGYFNGIFESIIGNTNHTYKLGLNAVYLDLKQQMDSLNDDRLEIVPGAFAEYTYTGARFIAVLGVRSDYHNIYGFEFSPRLHTKLAISEYTDLRFTIGKGWRVPNYMIDNISLLATSRSWVSPSEIKQEISWNTGVSLVHEFKLFKEKATFVVDYFYTFFENQMIVDRDINANQVVFSNLSGTSFSNSLQAELSFSPVNAIDVRFAYKLLDVRAQYDGKIQQNVMVPNHRGFMNIGYKTKNKKWMYDLTLSVFGRSRLPISQLDSVNFTTKNTSDIYPMLNGQITYVHKNLEIYVGGENLTNFKQQGAILDAENPFGNYFDATRVWGPIMGWNIYVGFRFAINKKETK